MRIVTNNELSQFKVLPFDVYTEKKAKIFDAGEVLTPGKLVILKNYSKLYTEDFSIDSDNTKGNTNSSTLTKMINFSYEGLDPTNFETVINKDANIQPETQIKIKYYYKKIQSLLLKGYYPEGLLKLQSLVGILKAEVLKKINKSAQGSRIRFMGEYDLCHTLNVAIISGLIAQKLEYTPMTIDHLMLAALLHDIGKLQLSSAYAQALITTNEEDVKEHPIVGYKLIKEKFDLPEDIAKVALEHHENNDGSGYPQGLSSDYISQYSQIINVANYYDNLAFNRYHTVVTNNKDVLRAMLEIGTSRFSAEMLYSFIHLFNYDDAKNFNDMMI